MPRKPYKSWTDKKHIISLKVKRGVLNRFDEKIQELGFNRSEAIEELMIEFLKQW